MEMDQSVPVRLLVENLLVGGWMDEGNKNKKKSNNDKNDGSY